MDLKDELNEKLRESCCMRDGEAVYRCLVQGADINSKHKINGWTCLHWAAKRGHTQLVEILLSKNADPTIRNNRNETAFDVADSEPVKAVLCQYMQQANYEQSGASMLQTSVPQDSVTDIHAQRARNGPRENEQATGFTPTKTESPQETPTSTTGSMKTEQVSSFTPVVKSGVPQASLPETSTSTNGQRDTEQASGFTPIAKAGVSQTASVTPTQPTHKPRELNFVPSYLANPVFPYAKKEDRTIPSFGKTSNQASRLEDAEEELVLKVRHANSQERDFIEIELNKNELTFDNLKRVCLKELEIGDCYEIRKVRKLPDTIIRKDKDVRRLKQFQEIEIITRPSSNFVSSTTQSYN